MGIRYWVSGDFLVVLLGLEAGFDHAVASAEVFSEFYVVEMLVLQQVANLFTVVVALHKADLK